MSDTQHMITPQEFATLARPCSRHLDDDEVMAYVSECEQLYIIPAIGYGNFKAAITGSAFDGTFDGTFSPSTAINGGEWEYNKPNGECHDTTPEKGLHYCVGLKRTLAYYAYAQMIKADGAINARSGTMRHDDQYAQHINDKMKQYNNIMNIAEAYMDGCLQYLKYHTVDHAVKPVRGGRARIHAIGD